ncbi:hypothetical protein Nmel_002518 [Mimus melanotis]
MVLKFTVPSSLLLQSRTFFLNYYSHRRVFLCI